MDVVVGIQREAVIHAGRLDSQSMAGKQDESRKQHKSNKCAIVKGTHQHNQIVLLDKNTNPTFLIVTAIKKSLTVQDKTNLL